MSTPRKKYTSVEEYLGDFTGETLTRLEAIRTIIKDIAPEASERISYNIPAFFVGKNRLVYYAGYDKHVSIYPIQSAEQSDIVKDYTSGRATAKFIHTKELPTEIIRSFVLSRYKDIEE
jgi:uncharacterized protein YdhG (YjbR/CyaY superfamily)